MQNLRDGCKNVPTYVLAKNKNIGKEMSFAGKTIRYSSKVELLGVALDRYISFKIHIGNICCNANNKIRALFRVRNFLTFGQAKKV